MNGGRGHPIRNVHRPGDFRSPFILVAAAGFIASRLVESRGPSECVRWFRFRLDGQFVPGGGWTIGLRPPQGVPLVSPDWADVLATFHPHLHFLGSNLRHTCTKSG